ncbi:MAG: hypothetical protein IKA64_00310 [Clostridia bacterium]|nr:hypothetical protein [Clostridia bacterium]
MKRLTALILLTVIFLFSCSARTVEPYEVVSLFRDGRLPSGRIYLSRAEEGEEHYAPAGLLSDMLDFQGEEPREWALLIHSRLDYVGELGVLCAESPGERLMIYEACERRVSLLTHSGTPGGGFVILRHGAVIYGFFPEPESAREYILGIIK